MDPMVEAFAREALPYIGGAVAIWSVAGAVLGGIVAMFFHVVLRRLGIYAGDTPVIRAARVIAAVWTVVFGMLFGATLFAAIGTYTGTSTFLEDSPFAQERLVVISGAGADGVAALTALAEDDGARGGERLRAFREAGGELPLQALDDGKDEAEGRLRETAIDEFLPEILASMPEETREAYGDGIRQVAELFVAQATAEGLLSVDPSFGRAWAQLPDAAAVTGNPTAISRAELADLIQREVVIPRVLNTLLQFLLALAGGLLITEAFFGAMPAAIGFLVFLLTRKR